MKKQEIEKSIEVMFGKYAYLIKKKYKDGYKKEILDFIKGKKEDER